MSEPWMVAWIPFVAFPIVWVGVCLLLGRLGGWGRMATHYRTSEPAPRGVEWFTTGTVGGVRYRNALVVAASPRGLYLSVLPLFRPGHPPLLVPWSAVQPGPPSRWFGARVRVRHGPTLMLPKRVLAQRPPD